MDLERSVDHTLQMNNVHSACVRLYVQVTEKQPSWQRTFSEIQPQKKNGSKVYFVQIACNTNRKQFSSE